MHINKIAQASRPKVQRFCKYTDGGNDNYIKWHKIKQHELTYQLRMVMHL